MLSSLVYRSLSIISKFDLYWYPRTLKNNSTNMEPEEKKHCADTNKSIGTHNGNFHCDDALACYMLRKLPEYRDARIVRSRDQSILDNCDVVVDVGGVYDPKIRRYDHHQRTFNETMQSLSDGRKSWVTKLSSAGLVYFHFGHRIISIIAGTEVDSDATNQIYDKVYENFVEEIDAIDNGISCSDGPQRYRVTTNLSSRVSYLNPSWNSNEDNFDERFVEATGLVGSEFTDRILATKNIWMPARSLVREAIDKRYEVDSNGVILHLNTPCPWKEHLFELEKTLDIKPEIKYVLYADQNNRYRVQCVPTEARSFTSRLSLPQAWCGLRGEVLSKQSGIAGCVFVHANGFIGGNDTYKGALEMAVNALNEKRD